MVILKSAQHHWKYIRNKLLLITASDFKIFMLHFIDA